MKTRLNFPEISNINIAFGGYDPTWFKDVLLEYDDAADSKWANMANDLFFNGGKVPVNEELPKEYRDKGIRILKAVMGSFTPKHEDKEAVCGLILKSLCEAGKSAPPPVTRRQKVQKIFNASTATNREIAEQLGITPRQVSKMRKRGEL